MLSENSGAGRPLSDGDEQVDQGDQQRFRADLSRAERDIGRVIDPGARALVITGIMLVLVLTAVLPWVGGAPGWQVLAGQADPALGIGLLPRLFSINSAIAGVLLGALALATRRWAIAWLAAMFCCVVTVEGVIAIWSRQTAEAGEPGPSFGLFIAVIAMGVLASQWLRIVWSRA
ncbi:hypothetical protein SAMN04487819_10794 [Actinopolyspora alba]|uniref:Uncharacterized protein n=1 Tax=Actinopolyspora alba TaxID=673379 RepID=A0A1I1XE30_9ACTN|nr:hypothetical protein SAMN04487819_10794 [Actinopolyspora alba]